jgi:hypothetical protein
MIRIFRIFTAPMITRCSKTADFTDYRTLLAAQNSPIFQWSISHFSELFPHLYICVRIFSCIFTALMIARCSKTADFTDYHIFFVAQKRPTFQWRYRTFLSFSLTYASVICIFFRIFTAQMIATTADLAWFTQHMLHKTVLHFSEAYRSFSDPFPHLHMHSLWTPACTCLIHFYFKNSKLLICLHDEPITSHQAPRGGGRGARGVGWGECCAGTHQGSSLRHEGQALHLPRGASLEGDLTHLASAHGVLGGTT